MREGEREKEGMKGSQRDKETGTATSDETLVSAAVDVDDTE